MDYIDVKYINLVSSRLPKFKKVKPHLYNFRCPLCGDSQKNKNKARGYLYRIKNNTNFKCHNCGINISFNNFLKDVDASLHKEYIFEKFKEGNTVAKAPAKAPEDVFKDLVTSKPVFKKKVVIDLPDAFKLNKSAMYLHSRAIFDGDFYYAKNFKEFVNTLIPRFFDSVEYGEERIVIPLVKDGELIGLQGRALSTNPVKYITVMINEEAPKIYGYDTIDKKSPVYVVEGPFDSTFLDNSVALCGSDGDLVCLQGSSLVFVYDNEPRNREIVTRIEGCIDRGDRVVIWPTGIRQKDINEMVLAGLNICDIIEENIYLGLEAKLKLTTWKKI